MKITAVTLKCGHIYCKNCLKTMFDTNVNDEYHFPPRCCRQFVPIDHLQDVLPQETLSLYHRKVEEYSTPHRLYCSNKTCTQFLGPRQDRASHISCSSCKTSTCAHCTAGRQDKANVKLGETLPRHTVIAGLQAVVRIRGPAPLEAAKRRVG